MLEKQRFLRTVNTNFRLFARHIVWVDPAWLNSIGSAKPASLAFLLKASLTHLPIPAKNAHVTIQNPPAPQPDVRRFLIGDLIPALRAIKPISTDALADHAERWLAEITESQTPIIADAVRSRLSTGLVFRAHVTHVDPKFRTITVSQARLFEEYHAGIVVGQARIVGFSIDGGKSVFAVFVDLEPGIRGRLHENDVSMHEWQRFTKYKIGDSIAVVVKAILSNGDIDLTTPAVARTNKERSAILEDQEYLNAIVQGVNMAGGVREGLFVEVAPGLRGYMPRRRLGIFQRSWIERYQKGDRLPVKILRVEGSRFDVAPQFASISVGFESNGYIISFLESRDNARFDYFAAFIEFLPGIQGFLHWSNTGSAGINLDDLSESQCVAVRVITLRSANKQYELELLDIDTGPSGLR